jgi:hypothetical protein
MKMTGAPVPVTCTRKERGGCADAGAAAQNVTMAKDRAAVASQRDRDIADLLDREDRHSDR